MQGTTAGPGLGEEFVADPAAEEAAIRRITDLTLELMQKRGRVMPRGQHPKNHGCVHAEFAVEPGLPAELAHGIFREPRTFPALVRFSNGKHFDDRCRDAHGMAIKLVGVEGTKLLADEADAVTHDFVLVDNPVFFIKDLAEYVAFSEKFAGQARSLPGRLAGLLPERVQDWIEMGVLRRKAAAPDAPPILKRLVDFVGKVPDSPLRARYWSTTPYALGPGAVKYSARPDLSATPAPAPSDSKDRLRLAMAAHLRRDEARFDFLVQLQVDPVAMPVEDPTVGWDETRSPYRKVATITIPPQTFETEAQLRRCEDLSFTPWHALPEHRPLGGINRARKAVYDAASRYRHERDEAPRAEPTST